MSVRGTVLEGLRLPVIGAPLFIVSQPDLVIAECKAGIVGSFPALNARPEALLEDWLVRITEGRAAHDAAHHHPSAHPQCGHRLPGGRLGRRCLRLRF